MLGALCARHRPPILNSLALVAHVPAAYHHDTRLHRDPVHLAYGGDSRRRHHTSSCRLSASIGGAASIWHAILPSGLSGGSLQSTDVLRNVERRGEGSWNVTWDARPARWLYRPDSAWLLFGVCACLAPVIDFVELKSEAASEKSNTDINDSNLRTEVAASEKSNTDINDSNLRTEVVEDADENKIARPSSDYKVTGVLADGRCLFRAIAHAACLRSGKEAPDGDHQRELADELRAKVVNELLERREETEWFIEGDFDAYVKEIQQPHVWGGEPELLMASHVLKAPISVYMVHRNSGKLVNIANYGKEYQKNDKASINVLFHGYGHYDILETLPAEICKKVDTE